MGYTRDTVKGVWWVGVFRASSKVVALLRTAILARILTPSQFGVVGIATIVLGFVEMLTETGINVFLVQQKRVEHYINTAWIISIVRGILIGLLIILSAPFIALFFNTHEAYNLLLLISVVPVVRGFINPSIVKFQKELAFGREFWLRFSIFSIDSSTAIILAFITRSAASLVWGFIVGALFEVILSFIFIRPKPKFVFNLKYVRDILHSGKWITASSILNYAFQNGDNIVVGRMLGASPLGLYQVGYKAATVPGEIVDSISRVTFPVYAKIATDTSRLKRAFIRTVGAVTLLTVPLGVILFIFTKELVEVFLGEAWFEVVPALKVLAAFGIVRALGNVAFPLFFSVKKQNYVTIVTFVAVIGLAVSVVPLVSGFGIVGAALAATIGAFASLPFVLYYTFKILR